MEVSGDDQFKRRWKACRALLDDESPYVRSALLAKFREEPEEGQAFLREIAEDMGLDKEFAYRKKKAAQYGSNFVKGIDKLAKKHGFNTKKEYLQRLLS